MGLAKFEIVGKDGSWCLRRQGKQDNRYATKGAAFEAAIAAASIALLEGHDVTMTAAPSETTRDGPAN